MVIELKKDGMIFETNIKTYAWFRKTSQSGGIIGEEDEELNVKDTKVDRASSGGLEPYDYNSGFVAFKI